MPRLDQLNELQRQTALYFPCLEHDDSPWTPWGKDLAQSKLSIVTTVGLHLRDDHPFEGGDPSYRAIPSSANPNDVIQSHASIGFDHTGYYRDINLAFPLDRMRELVERGVLGSVAANYYSFMGAQRNPARIIEETAPEVVQLLKADQVDAVLLIPM